MYRSPVPFGQLGEWSVGVIWDDAGAHKSLFCNRVNLMADMPGQVEEQMAAVEAARVGGDVLVTGLGLGVVADLILNLTPSRVTAVDLSREVIALVGPTMLAKHGDRLRVIHADALAWQPDRRFAVGWHDIGVTREDMIAFAPKLLSRYAPWCDWQGCWGIN